MGLRAHFCYCWRPSVKQNSQSRVASGGELTAAPYPLSRMASPVAPHGPLTGEWPGTASA
jgi:hypothetical protein